MPGADHQVLEAAAEWLAAGQRVWLVTVAETWGSAPRPVGSILALREDGRIAGSVSGGCVEQELRDRIAAADVPPGRPWKLGYGVTREDVERVGLPCGGRLELVVAPLLDAAVLAGILRVLAGRGLVALNLDLNRGSGTLVPATPEQPRCLWRDNRLTRVFGPAWQLLLIGAGQLSRHVARLALSLDYRVLVCDPRPEYRDGWDVPDTELATGMPDDVVRTHARDARSAVVTLTHDPRLDDMALMEALDGPAFYVGALGSRGNNEKRRVRLAELGLAAEAVARLHGPVGLPIGGRSPPEIAVSILADMIAVRHGRRVGVQEPALED